MKHLLIFILSLVSSAACFSQEKKFIAGITAGANTSQFDGDTYAGYHKLGINAGLALKRPINEKFAWQFEICYSQKGARKIPNNNPNQYILNLNYIEIPICLKWNYKKFSLEPGLGLGALIHTYEEINYLNVTGVRKFNPYEFFFNGGISYPLTDKIDFSWEVSYSLLPVRPHAGGTTYRLNLGESNNVLSFNLKYFFKKKNE